jgi:hypothetical protein
MQWLESLYKDARFGVRILAKENVGVDCDRAVTPQKRPQAGLA